MLCATKFFSMVAQCYLGKSLASSPGTTSGPNNSETQSSHMALMSLYGHSHTGFKSLQLPSSYFGMFSKANSICGYSSNTEQSSYSKLKGSKSKIQIAPSHSVKMVSNTAIACGNTVPAHRHQNVLSYIYSCSTRLMSRDS